MIRQFTDFTSKPLKATVEGDVFEYLDYRKGQQGIMPRRGKATGLSGATIRNELCILASCFTIYHRRGEMSYHPIAGSGIRFPHTKKNQKRPTEMIPFDKVSEILQKPPRNTKAGVRDRAILAVLFGAALRKSEAINLTLDDVKIHDESTLFLYLHETKSGRDREQCLASWASPAITRLIEQRISEGASAKQPLFTKYINKRFPNNEFIPIRTFDRIFKKYTKDTPGMFSCHSARATAISNLWEKETDPRRVQEFARHSDFRSTMIYDRRSLRDTARKLFY